MLDLCIALRLHACALIDWMGVVSAFSLPIERKENIPFSNLEPCGNGDSRICVRFSVKRMMWAEDSGEKTIPKDHPDATEYWRVWPYDQKMILKSSFDLQMKAVNIVITSAAASKIGYL